MEAVKLRTWFCRCREGQHDATLVRKANGL